MRDRILFAVLTTMFLSGCGGNVDDGVSNTSTGGASSGMASKDAGKPTDAGYVPGLCYGIVAVDGGISACPNLDASVPSCRGGSYTGSLSVCDAAQSLIVQATESPCEFTLPNAPPDWTKIWVMITKPQGTNVEIVSFDGAGCGNVSSAWYIPVNADSPRIGLCPCSCARLAELSSLRVIYGCGSGGVYMK